MKAAIVTIYGLNNFGNRLQNYAVHSTLTRLGIQAYTLVPKQISKIKSQINLYNQVSDAYNSDPVATASSNPLIVREMRFKDFNHSHISEFNLEYDHCTPNLNELFDYFVTGSDQVWNPMFRSSTGRVGDYLLDFASPEKRVCFSPSIGLDELPDKWKPLYTKELNKFRYLSVREESGAALITRLTGRVPDVIIDPTLMIPAAEWETLAEALPGFDCEKGGYILNCFLGDKDTEISPQTRALIDSEAGQKGLSQVSLYDRNDPVLFSAGPAQFIELIKNAALICTDSFHATVFSILFHKPFLVFNRSLTINGKEVNMSNRIITLLQMLGLNDKLPDMPVEDRDIIWKNDYSSCHSILAKKQAASVDFLKKSFKLK